MALSIFKMCPSGRHHLAGEDLVTLELPPTLVHSLAGTRPDKSVKTWWRTPIDETARKELALEVFLPEKATLSELHPSVLAPGALPSLWTSESVTVADVVAYFSGGRTVMVQREGYEDPVVIPACPHAAVEAAISDAVRPGILWLVNGPASFHPIPWTVLRHAIDVAIKARWVELAGKRLAAM